MFSQKPRKKSNYPKHDLFINKKKLKMLKFDILVS